jgi:hypothetical protein
MNQRERELLEKQFSWLRPSPSYGSLKLAVTVAILLVGLGVGSTVILHDPNSTEVGATTSESPRLPVAHIGL